MTDIARGRLLGEHQVYGLGARTTSAAHRAGMSQTTTTIYRATAATSQRQHTLTAADRCDQCRARAYVSFTTDSGTVLLLCGHHFSRHEEAITARGYPVLDERDQLYSARASGTGIQSPAGR